MKFMIIHKTHKITRTGCGYEFLALLCQMTLTTYHKNDLVESL